jgi:hypothetical protein
VAAYCGFPPEPVVYDYGSNVVIQDSYVYVDGEPTVSEARYAEQATKLVDRGRKARPPADEGWQPLGVFGLIQGEEKVAEHIFQLAVNKRRVLRGNYYDAVADESRPVYGSVGRKNQRVAWSIGRKKKVVFETGLENLTKGQTTVLVHYGKKRTRQMVLVRLEEPRDQKGKEPRGEEE